MKQTLLFLAAVLFSVASLQAQTYDVTFKVDMGVKAFEGQFDPASDNVYVAGNFTNWGTGALQMTDANTDTIYETTVSGFAADSVLAFKFIYGPSATAGTWESDPNRAYTVPNSNSVFQDWFDRDSIYTVTTDGTILFSVDMSVMSEVLIFVNTEDSVQVRGSFNGWNDSEPLRSKMVQDFANPDFWSLNVTFDNYEVGTTQEYKYYVDLADVGIWTDGWERPSSRGGGNRQVIFEGSNTQVAPQYYYDDIEPYMVIKGGQNLSGKFSVDMTSAMDSALQGPNYFVPATDTVYWISEQPTFEVTQNWADRLRVLPLTRVGTSNVYEGTLNVTEPSFNTFLYRFAYAHFDGTSYSLIYEDAGFSAYAYRLRYMPMTAPRTFPQQNYNFPQDTWIKSGEKPQEQEPLGVSELPNLTPQKFDLSQNYPNPFNPSTMIRFSVPQAGMVTLKVFNVLGEEVKTLVNRELVSGVYEVDFNASGLGSGIYFYTIQSGNFSATKKMMLIK